MKTKKEQIKQKIIAIFVVTFMFAMMIGTVNINLADATGGNTILQQVVSAGSLSLETAAQVNFNTFTLNGASFNSLANLTQVNFRDTRGSGAGYNVVGTANNMQAGTNIIANTQLRWSPGTIYGLEGSSTTGVTAGASYSGNFGDPGGKTLASATSENGMGNYTINGTTLNLLLAPSVAAGTYQNTLLLTIS